jgi:hypothetical protein
MSTSIGVRETMEVRKKVQLFFPLERGGFSVEDRPQSDSGG